MQQAQLFTWIDNPQSFIRLWKIGCYTNPNQLSTPGATMVLVIYFHFLLGLCVVLPYWF
jgi:hypothetical protein